MAQNPPSPLPPSAARITSLGRFSQVLWQQHRGGPFFKASSKSQELSAQASQVALIVKNPPANAGGIREPNSIPGSGRSPGGGSSFGYLLQYPCLGNLMDRGAWWATVHGVTKSWIRLSNTHTHTHLFISGVYLLYNVVLVSAVQQSKSTVHIHISPLP